SDQRAAYRNIHAQCNIGHLTVNHILHLLNYVTGAHVHCIENLWARLKGKVAEMRGLLGMSLNKYLDERVWHYNYVHNAINAKSNLINIY
ncbi:hypothetical protein BDAP_001698, partial [Binucleata daphniae]